MRKTNYMVILPDNVFREDDEISKLVHTPRIWRFLGFSKEQILRVMEPPLCIGKAWSYRIEVIGYKYKWLGITVKQSKIT